MNDVDEYQNQDGSGKEAASETDQISQAKDNAGDRQGGDGHQVQGLPHHRALGPGGHIGRGIPDDRADHRDQKGDQKRIGKIVSHALIHHILDMIQRKGQVIGIALYEGHNSKRRQHQQHKADHGGAAGPHQHIPETIASHHHFLGAEAHGFVVLFRQIQQKGHQGGNQQDQTDKGAAGEILQADDFGIQILGQGGEPPAHRQGHAVIGEHHGEHREGGGNQGAFHILHGYGKKSVRFGNPQHLRRLIGGGVGVFHGVRQHQERHREGVQDGAQKDTVKPQQMALHPQQPGDDAVVSEQVDQADAVGDRRNQHGQRGQHRNSAFAGNPAAVDRKGQKIGQRHRNHGGTGRDPQGIEHHVPELTGGDDSADLTPPDLAEHGNQRQQNRDAEENNQYRPQSAAEQLCFAHGHTPVLFRRKSIFSSNWWVTNCRT